MSTPDLLDIFVEGLEQSGADYMITGGVASVIYGDPRFTRDLDVVVALRASDVDRLAAAFDDPAFYMPPTEVMREEATRPRGGHFNLIHRDTALRADVYLTGDDPLHVWAMEHRRRLTLTGARALWVAPIEYVVLRKLEYYSMSGSERHLRDIAMMLRISGDQVDRDLLESWLVRLGLTAAYQEAREHPGT